MIQSWKTSKPGPKKGKRQASKIRTQHDYSAISERLMQFAEERPMFTAAEVARDMKLPRFAVQYAVKKLVKAGKLATVSRGAGRKLSKAA